MARGSGLFAAFLAERDPPGFRSFLEALHRGEDFRGTFESHLDGSVSEAWTAFVRSIRSSFAGFVVLARRS